MRRGRFTLQTARTIHSRDGGESWELWSIYPHPDPRPRPLTRHQRWGLRCRASAGDVPPAGCKSLQLFGGLTSSTQAAWLSDGRGPSATFCLKRTAFTVEVP